MTEAQQFETFVKDYQNMVYTTALRLLGKESDAEDISQEVFLKAYEHYAMLQQSKTAGGWLKTVARNLCLNHLSRYRARWRFFSDMATDRDGEETPLEWASGEDQAEALAVKDQRRILEAALHKLPAAQRVPLVLYHFEDLAYEEIAGKLRISLSKVKTDIHRGREALRRRLQVGSLGEELGSVYGVCGLCLS